MACLGTQQTHIRAYGSLVRLGLGFPLSSKQFVQVSSSTEFNRDYSSVNPSLNSPGPRLVGSLNFIMEYLFGFILFLENQHLAEGVKCQLFSLLKLWQENKNHGEK